MASLDMPDSSEVKNFFMLLKEHNIIPSVAKDPKDAIALIQALMTHQAKRVYAYDWEVIEAGPSYKKLLNEILSYARPEAAKAQIVVKDSFYDWDTKRAGITLSIAGETYSRDWEQDGDGVTPEFMDEVLRGLVEPALGGEFIEFPNTDVSSYELWMLFPNSIVPQVKSFLSRCDDEYGPDEEEEAR